MSDFWAAKIAAELSQGDLLTGIWVGSSVAPRKALHKGSTGSKGLVNWAESDWKPDSEGVGHFLARGRDLPSIVLSHSCEIDKNGASSPVLLAPVFPFSKVPAELQLAYREGRRHAFLPLVALSGVIEESYADLRMMYYLQRKIVDTAERRCSVSPAGEFRLAAQVVAFLTRIDLPAITKTVNG